MDILPFLLNGRMKRVTVILIALCIALFVGVASLGVRFINTPQEEGFTAQSVVVTRASDCNCLPGYIPSNNKPSTKLIGRENQTVQIYGITRVRYGIGDKWVNKTVSETFQATNNFFGIDPAPGIAKIVESIEAGEETGDSFFCQGITDPGKIRKCY